MGRGRPVPHPARWVRRWEVRLYEIPSWLWVVTLSLVVLLLAVDYVVAYYRREAVGLREAIVWSVFYIAVALLFGLAVWAAAGGAAAVEYYAGWAVEKSLSLDNLFVFVIIMGTFAVPPQHQQKALLFGITVALRMRALMIIFGAAAISVFSPTFLLFGLLLLWTAIQLARHRNQDPNIENNPVLRLTRRVLPVTTNFHGSRLVARVSGKRVVTPLF